MKNQNLSKKLVITLEMMMMLLVSLTNISWTQIPTTMSYQGCLRNNNGDPQTGSFNLLFKIYESESGGTAIWEENHTGVQVDNGYFNVILGGLDQIPFNKQYWLGISVNGGQELTPRSELTSVAYSLNTKSIPDQVVTTGKIFNGAVTPEKINTTGASTDQALVFNGSNLVWKTMSSGSEFSLPYYGNTSIEGHVFWIVTEANSGRAGFFWIDNENNSDDVLHVKTDGQGSAGNFRILNSNNQADALTVETEGLGHAGFFDCSNDMNNHAALQIEQSGAGEALYARARGTGRAGYFEGDVHINGTLSKSAGSFLIDHPLDPENRILRHSFVESPEMMNIYKGRAKLDNGKVEIKLPDYFDALNHPQGREINLTPVNGWSPLFLAGEIKNNRFSVKTTKDGNPEQEFSWIIYGVRNDKYARNHPIIVEEEKGINNKFKKGEYLNSNVKLEK